MLNGYVIYKKKLSIEEQTFGLSCMKDKVDYTLLKTFIDNYFLPKIQFENPVYLKARISNNNNSIDASLFHSDLYNFTSEKEIPVYTALCYFDKAELELIPGSHIKRDSFIDDNNKRIVLELEPGDIVVFNSLILHRGVNYSKGVNRRVLQVFQIFPTQELYKENVSKILTVDTSSKKNNSLYYIAHIKWLIEIINMIIFYLTYNNLKYKLLGIDLPPWEKKGRYICYEPGGRLDYKHGLVGDNNINIIFNDSDIVKHSYFYTLIHVLILFIIFRYIIF